MMKAKILIKIKISMIFKKSILPMPKRKKNCQKGLIKQNNKMQSYFMIKM